ncbi:MAG: hypothetical protein H6Q74_979 [Firmicutes bacterium]|nr:hypothetical protein [Bacillota bacterium]
MGGRILLALIIFGVLASMIALPFGSLILSCWQLAIETAIDMAYVIVASIIFVIGFVVIAFKRNNQK